MASAEDPRNLQHTVIGEGGSWGLKLEQNIKVYNKSAMQVAKYVNKYLSFPLKKYIGKFTYI